jgi:type IV pilus assembly protein PilQ
MAEPRTNQLFFLDTPNALKQIKEVIQWLDIPVRQVMIEAKIVEAEEQFGKSLGIRLGGAYASSFAAPWSASAKPVNVAIGGQGLANAGGVQPDYWLNLPAGPAGQALYPPANFAVSLFNAAAYQFINLEISALEADGKGKVVASPRVVTANQTKASIEQGTELPYQVNNGNGAASIAFRKANLKLEVTPQITPEGAVVLELDIAKDSVGQTTSAGFAINTKHVKTQVLVDNGGTVVIGGILESADKQDEARVPGLASLPLLGRLFQSEQTTQRKTELLIFVTPRVLADSLPPAASNTLRGSIVP